MPTWFNVSKDALLQLWRIIYRDGRIILDYIHQFADAIFYFFLYMTIAFTMVYLLLSVIALFSKKKEDEEGHFDAEKAPLVTIQIPTRNEIIALRCAKKCLDFDYPKNKYDILIGDDSDKEHISKELSQFSSQYENVQVLKREKNIGYKPGNLNNMLKHTKGDIIVIFDSDFVPQQDFLRRIVTPFMQDKEVSIVQAKWNFNNFNQNLVTVLASTIVYVFHHIVLTFMRKGDTASLCGSAEAIKKKDLLELGGWKSGSLTEDIEYSLRLHKNNKKLVYLPDLECYSDVPFKATDLYKQQMRWAYGVISSYKSHLGGLLINKKLSLKKKILSLGPGFGYLLPLLILSLFLFGGLSFITHRPAPLDLPRFFSELGINTLLTSGLLVASIIALSLAKKASSIVKMLLASFSIGLVTTYYVNKGIFKSLLKQPMEWYLLNKDINIPKGK